MTMDDESIRELRSAAECAGLSMEFAELLADAERYRWLRDNVDIETEYYHQQDACVMTLHFHCPPEMFFCTDEEEPGIDDAIDAAMTGKT